MLLVLDELQWASQPSLLLLEFLAGQLSDSKIMLVGTYRDIEVTRNHPLSRTLAQPSRSDSYSRQELVGLALMAVLRGDVGAAKEQYAALFAASGTNSYVSGGRILGLLAHTMGEHDQAVVHFEESLTFCRKANYKPELAWACHDYADTLLQCNHSGDQARAMDLLEESISLSRDLNMRPLLELATTLQEKLNLPRRGPPQIRAVSPGGRRISSG